MGPFTLDDDVKLQCDNVVVYWVLYPFHDDIVMTLLWSSPSVNEPLVVRNKSQSHRVNRSLNKRGLLRSDSEFLSQQKDCLGFNVSVHKVEYENNTKSH